MSWAHDQLAVLRPIYAGRWDIWYVKHYPNDIVWCAKRAGTEIATIHAGTPEHLAEYIAEAETGDTEQ